jgi:hypothetical protein
MREVTLPSGAKLNVALAPFADSKALYQALLEEAKGVKMDPQAEVDVNLFKDLFCAGLSSKKIEAAAMECAKRSIYNGEKLTLECFEPENARQDFYPMLFEVTKENVSPFTNDLYAKFKLFSAMIQSVPA